MRKTLIIILMIFTLTYFVCAQEITCVDTDNGNNWNTKGQTYIMTDGVISSEIKEDVCFSSEAYPNGVHEYHCTERGEVTSSGGECPNGCKDGACVKEGTKYGGGGVYFDYLHLFPPKEYLILDGEDDFFYADMRISHNISQDISDIKVEMRIPELNLNQVQILDSLPGIPDQFHIDIPENTPSGKYKIEFKVTYKVKNQGWVLSKYFTRDISKKNEVICRDSDGLEHYRYGNVTLIFPSGEIDTINDACRGDTIYEYYCGQEEWQVDMFKCLHGCKDGACIFEEGEPCDGCLEEDICYQIGHRKESNFCSDNKEFIPQNDDDAPCDNNFECKSNICIDSKCIEVGLFESFINWFKNIFG